MDPIVASALRAALTLLFLSAALHKLHDWAAFGAALEGYRLVPRALLAATAPALVALELGIAAGLALGLRGAGAAGAALLALYSLAIGVNLARGRRDIDCGCGGPAGRVRLRPALLARNAVLIGLALAVALPVGERSLVWLDAFTLVAAVGTAALLYAALETLLATRPIAAARQRSRDRQGAVGLVPAPILVPSLSQPLPDGRGSEFALERSESALLERSDVVPGRGEGGA